MIVANWNSGDLLARCLDTLRGQTLPPERIIVVDNASTDHSLEAARRGDDVLVLALERNRGFAAANNEGLRAVTTGEWIALLNPDAFPSPSWLERLLHAARANPGFSFFASSQLSAASPDRVDGTGDLYTVAGLAWRRDHQRLLARATREAGEVFAPCAAAALYRRDALREVGGFDDGFFCYFEDVDLAFRLRLAGHRCLFVPDAVVHHVGSAITGRTSDFSVYHGHRNLVWTWCKNMPAALVALYWPLHLVLNLVDLAWFTARGQGRVIWRAKWDALRGLPRVLGQRKAVQATRRVGAWELRRAMTRGLAAYASHHRSWAG